MGAPTKYILAHLVFVVIGQFFAMNLFIGMLIWHFDRMKKKNSGSDVQEGIPEQLAGVAWEWQPQPDFLLGVCKTKLRGDVKKADLQAPPTVAPQLVQQDR
eukprot:gene1691-4349_t